MVDYRPMVDNIDPLAGLHLFPLPGVGFGPLFSFQVDFFAQYGVLSFWLFFTPKTTHFWTYLDLEWHLDGA